MMAISPTYPGLYVQELPSGVHPITGVATSNAAFVDFFPRGPVGATRVTSWSQFERDFGGLDRRSEASYAIQQFYLNGGSTAFVVRVRSGASPAFATLVASQYGYGPGHSTGYGGSGTVTVSAASPGQWGDSLQVAVDHNVRGGDATLFNLVVREVQVVAGKFKVLQQEVFRNLSLDKTSSRYVVDVIKQGSRLLGDAQDSMLGGVPDATGPDVINNPQDSNFTPLTKGSDGVWPGTGMGKDDLLGDPLALTGIHALDTIAPDVFNILCIPAASLLDAGQLEAVATGALQYCAAHRAMYILDLPASLDDAASYDAQLTAITGFTTSTVDKLRSPAGQNGAVYFPRLSVPDPLNESRPRKVGASGTLAGVWARVDGQRGVWKAPAGTDSGLAGATLAVNLTDPDNGSLNQRGVNVLRSFPVFGTLSWGGRTLMGADQEASEWKYIPVRRTALYIEESLFEGLKWVVFEPNAEPLWAQVRLNVGGFMHDLFRKGAFAGLTPQQAYLVKCDGETTTQTDVDNGIVNILVGFAPLKPAEFVIIQIEQLAGQIQT
jgi:phage tail sheath protein FI